jgi:hypothetical protein
MTGVDEAALDRPGRRHYFSPVADYVVTLIQSVTTRTRMVRARSATDAARAVHAAEGDPVGACYRVQGSDELDGSSTIQVLRGRIRVMPEFCPMRVDASLAAGA